MIAVSAKPWNNSFVSNQTNVLRSTDSQWTHESGPSMGSLPPNSTSVTLYIIAILIIYVIIFVALVISNFVNEHSFIEESLNTRKQMERCRWSGKASRCINQRLRTLFITGANGVGKYNQVLSDGQTERLL